MSHFQWTPNFYIVFVAPAGVATKSTSVRIGTKLLRQIPNIYFGPSSLTWQFLVKALSEAQTLVKYGKTPEGDDSYLPMACITCAINELGTFLQPSEAKMVDVFTDLWDAQLESWSHGTATHGSTKIENPWLNIIAAVTPAWLRENFPESLIGGGLTSRMIFVFADKKRHLVAYPGLERISEEVTLQQNDLVADLLTMSQLIGEYVIEPEGIVWGTEWYYKHWTTRPEHLSNERFGGYIARKQTHLHKLAIVLAAAQRNELIITKKDLIMANAMVTGLELDMINVFESIGTSDTAKNMHAMLMHLSVYGKMSRDKLWQKCANTITPPAFNEALDGATRAGYMRLYNNGGELMVEILPEAMKPGT
jgi:hypothetical protein